ncbi:hypothetical protein KKG83_00535 [Candidatus Micrarchaeota archaeon]|nr:hypothetical protein [Candidatus Micrarchaeota archaeon]MBU2475938.1 hypothetical protein [Candidatus Micrarchaeota archaeon]
MPARKPNPKKHVLKKPALKKPKKRLYTVTSGKQGKDVYYFDTGQILPERRHRTRRKEKKAPWLHVNTWDFLMGHEVPAGLGYPRINSITNLPKAVPDERKKQRRQSYKIKKKK